MTSTLADRQIAILGELSELGLVMARAAKQLACDGETVPSSEDMERLTLAYDRAARAVRLSIMLQEKLLQAPQDPVAERVAERVAVVRRAITRIGDRQKAWPEALNRRLGERLDRDYAGDILDRPVSELIAMICKDLGLKPDWLQLVEEAWAKAEIESGKVGWPLAGLNPPPLGDGDPPMPEGLRRVEGAFTLPEPIPIQASG